MKKYILFIATVFFLSIAIAQPSVQIIGNTFFPTAVCYSTYPPSGQPMNIAMVFGVTSADSITVNYQVTSMGVQTQPVQIFKTVNGVDVVFPRPAGSDQYEFTICATASGITNCKQTNIGIGIIENNMVCAKDSFIKSSIKRKDNLNIYLIDNDVATPCNFDGNALRQLAINNFPAAYDFPITNILRQPNKGTMIIDNSNAEYTIAGSGNYRSSPNIDYTYIPNANQKYNIKDTFSYIASNGGVQFFDKTSMDRSYYPKAPNCSFQLNCANNDTAIAYISIDTLLDNLVGNCYYDVNNDNQLNYIANPLYAEPVLANVKVTLVQNNETQITNLSNLFSGNVLNNTFVFNDLKLNNYTIQLDYDTSLYELKPGFILNNIILTNLPLVNGERVFNIPFKLKNATPIYKSIAVFNSNNIGCNNGNIQSAINVINLGNTISNNTIKVKFDSLMTNIVCSPLPSTIDVLNKTYTWNLTRQAIGSLTQINVVYTISNLLNHIGAYVNVTSTSYTKDTFNVVKDSISTSFSNQIRCAFDPNDKQVNINALNLSNTQRIEDLIYTIRFQNTGNAPAANILIGDILSSNLDVKSFQFLASSHPVSSVQLTSSNEVRFAFNGINLPDSVSNEAASHGYVTFKIKPKQTLIVGDSISNNASIYFDNNPAIITNTVVTRTGILTAIKSNKLQAFKIYPNPARNFFTVTLDNTSSNQFVIQLINVSGKIEKEVNVNTSTTIVQNNDLKGMYIVRIIERSTNEIIGVNKILFE